MSELERKVDQAKERAETSGTHDPFTETTAADPNEDAPKEPIVAVFSGRITLRGSVGAPSIRSIEAAIEGVVRQISGASSVRADLTRTDR